jgi:hypothetical protein
MTPKLGMLPKTQDEHAFRLRAFVDVSTIVVPKTHDRKLGKPWDMLGNDQYGDCADVARANGLKIMCHTERKPFTVNAAQVVADYLSYSPDDEGTDPDAMMRMWRKKAAFGMPPIQAYLSADPAQGVVDIPRIDFLFGTCFMGFALPRAVQGSQGSWPVPPYKWQTDPAWQPYSWGGHMTMSHGWTTKGVKQVTWARDEWLVPNEFLRAYLVAAYGVIHPVWFNLKGNTPQGLNNAALLAELARLG